MHARLETRGLVNDLIHPKPEGWTCAYAGFDATADSLHVGHLTVFRALHALSAQGVETIALLGEGTSRVGDPSFRSSERSMMNEAQVKGHADKIRKQLERLLPAERSRVVSNAEWLGEANLLGFLTETGKHFTLSRMLSFDSVKTRLGSGLTFLEFAYMTLQARDFQELSNRFGCDVQVGGADQWANILCGVDLIRKAEGREVSGLTVPLLTRSDGRKMGKSDGHAIWLDPEMTTPNDFWQFWRNTPDEDVARFLTIFTDVDEGEIVKLCDASLNEAKALLADEITRWVHGESVLRAIRNGDDSAIRTLSVDGPLRLARALADIGAVESGKAAKRTILNGVRVNGEMCRDETAMILGTSEITIGKRRFRVIFP